MFRGYNRQNRQNIFGPSVSKMTGSGFSFADQRQDPLFMRGEGFSLQQHDPLMMHGEGLGSMFGSIFRKILPAESGIAKKVASSKALKEVGKQVYHLAFTYLCFQLRFGFPLSPLAWTFFCEIMKKFDE